MANRLRRGSVLLCLTLAGLGWVPAGVAQAQAPGPGTWLETSPLVNWNTPGAAVPAAPPPFADGQFAGTISPAPMDSRTDGSGRILDVRGAGLLTGQFVRYAATDPLCCPSSVFTVEYAVDRGGSAPILVPRSATRTSALAAR